MLTDVHVSLRIAQSNSPRYVFNLSQRSRNLILGKVVQDEEQLQAQK